MLKIGSKYRIARRLGGTVFEKTSTQKFALSEQKKRFANKGKRPKMPTEYGKQLIAKQKLRYTYGIKERKLSEYANNALSSDNNTIETLYSTLESRLDSVVYRLGFADTRRMARQIVSHGHIYVNGRRLNVPSYLVSLGDKITVKESSHEREMFKKVPQRIKENRQPKWLKLDSKSLEAEVTELPTMGEQSEFDFKKIIEFYTR